MNRYGDFTAAEFKMFMFGIDHSRPTLLGTRFSSFTSLTDTPERIRFKVERIMTPVKDQNFCAGGPIFAAVGTLKSAFKLLSVKYDSVPDC